MAITRLSWRCDKAQEHYIVVCSNGAFEVAMVIERHVWNRSIDRCLLLRRAAQRAKSSLEEFMASIE